MTDSTNGNLGSNSAAQLKSIIERIEHLEEEKKERADDIREVIAEAKGNGFDPKAIRAIVKRRKADADELAEHELLVETYLYALGDLKDTPLGQSALERAMEARVIDPEDVSHHP